LTNGAALVGFTLSNGSTRGGSSASIDTDGGGAWCEGNDCVLANCTIAGNLALIFGGGVNGGTVNNCTVRNNQSYAGNGGGAANATLLGSTLLNNSAYGYGGGASDCSLYNCTLSQNSARDGGGAAWGYLSNCVLSANSSTARGGGAEYGTLDRCVLNGNSSGSGGGAFWATVSNSLVVNNLAYYAENSPYAESSGGGLALGTANNCTIVGNTVRRPAGLHSTYRGGGVSEVAMNNCIIYFNSGSTNPNCGVVTAATNCCSMPLLSGTGNFSSDPAFVDRANGNYHLSSASPCINAGFNAGVSGCLDLDGVPRIAGGTVDVGAYEFPSPASLISYAWLLQYGLPTSGSADYLDADGDGMNNWQEWIADTNPTNADSIFRIVSVSKQPPLSISFQGSAKRIYTLLASDDLKSPWASVAGQEEIPGTETLMSLADTNAVGTRFYRLAVEVP
jgi:hypothetical protein